MSRPRIHTRNKLKKRDGDKCNLGLVGCTGNTKLLTIDHIIRKRDGGTWDLNNLQLLCRSCHDIKDEIRRKEKKQVSIIVKVKKEKTKKDRPLSSIKKKRKRRSFGSMTDEELRASVELICGRL